MCEFLWKRIDRLTIGDMGVIFQPPVNNKYSLWNKALGYPRIDMASRHIRIPDLDFLYNFNRKVKIKPYWWYKRMLSKYKPWGVH